MRAGGIIVVASAAFVSAQDQPLITSGTIAEARSLTAAGASFAPQWSADGQSVLFLSLAANLVTNSHQNSSLNLFVRQLGTAQTILISANRAGTGGGNDHSTHPSISSNGLVVAFESLASDLADGDNNGVKDVYVRLLPLREAILISRSYLGPFSGNAASGSPVLSGDGRFVAFTSRASDIVPGDTNNASDIFLHDLETGLTKSISAGLPRASINPSISGDGGHVAFVSGLFQQEAIYVWKASSDQFELVSSGTTNFLGNQVQCANPVISANGRHVAFQARSSSGPPMLFRYNIETAELDQISTNVQANTWAILSADGTRICYEADRQIHLWDAQTRTSTFISAREDGTPANAPAWFPSLTGHGTSVAFVSEATNLTELSSDAQLPRLYVRHLNTGALDVVTPFAIESDPVRTGASYPAISPDGSKVVFESDSNQLVENDLNRSRDVFLHRLESGRTECVSTAALGNPSLTSLGHPVLGTNNFAGTDRFLLFVSSARDVVPGITNGFSNVYVHDFRTGSNILVNVSVDETPGDGPSGVAAMSGDGRFVAFSSAAGNLVSETNGIHGGVFLRDLQQNTTRILSTTQDAWITNATLVTIDELGRRVVFNNHPNPTYSADPQLYVWDADSDTASFLIVANNGFIPSSPPVYSHFQMSRNGKYAAFSSRYDLVMGGLQGSPNTYLRDLETSQNRLVSRREDGTPLNTSDAPNAISPDERLLAFNADVITWTGPFPGIYIHDIAANTNSPAICTNCFSPSFSGDGRRIVYISPEGSGQQIRLLELETGISSLISVNHSGETPASGHSHSPLITRDGRYVVFASRATDLVPNDTNRVTDIFVRDTLLNTTTLVSMNRFGTSSADGTSTRPVLASDGRTIFFYSYASDMVERDYNYDRDIFVLRLGSGDSYGDGMDDDWEMTYFGTLNRDGTGDFDGDGHTDLEEFLAGTDPTNSGSVLRAMLLTHPNGVTTILWPSVSGKEYRVEYKDGFAEGGWSALPGTISGTGGTATAQDPNPAYGQRFYRVMVLP
jgi:Tol biopolymer transport system component